MTRMTGPDCVVRCNLINTYIHTYIHTYILSVLGVISNPIHICTTSELQVATTSPDLQVHRYARRYFQHAHFIPIVGVGKRGEY